MSRDARASDFFVAGGTLHPDNPSYVKRPADDELFNLALSGEYCYVLTPRQMGKSSLMVRTARRLREQGVHTAIIDLTEMGTVQAETWYLDFITELSRALRLRGDPDAWWKVHSSLGPEARFRDFLRDVVLKEIEGQVVIFIDEIDFTLGLDFSDDFFAAIRAMYNARARDPQFKRLSLVLLGAASPPDLIKDRTRTPFNIGQGIMLDDFSRTDAAVLQEGLEGVYPGQGEAIFTRIYHWTNGHPYLTQKLCQASVRAGNGPWLDERIDILVKDQLLSTGASKEANLKFVRDRILTYPQQRRLLDIYRQVYKGKKVVDDKQSPLHNQLKLSGLVKTEKRYLRVRNKIYRHVFNLRWIKENTPRGRRNVVTLVGIAVLVLGLVSLIGAFWYNTVRVPNQANQARLNFYPPSAAPQERVASLATLFNLQGLLGTPNYDGEARELFFGLTGEEQLALFNVEDDRIVIVIKGLYVTLADVDNTDRTGPLLESMAYALEGLQERTNETNELQTEIDSWIDGRKAARQGLYDAALTYYDKAIAKNADNPATLYERARVLTELREYQQALNNLDRVMGIVARAAGPTPTAAVLTTFTPATPTDTPSLPTPEPTDTSTPSKSGTPSNVPTASPGIITSTSTSILTATPTPTAIPVPLRVTSRFANTSQIIGAIRRLIASNPNLVSFLQNATDSEYPNLQEFGLVPIVPTQPPNVCNSDSGYEENDELSQACNLVFGQLYSAYPDDVEDIYYFFLSHTASVNVEVTDYEASEPGYLYIYDAINIPTPIASEYFIGTEAIPLENLPPGKYYVRVYTYDGSFNPERQYQLFLVPIAGSPSTATAIHEPLPTPTSSPIFVTSTPTTTPPPTTTATRALSPTPTSSPIFVTFTPTTTPPPTTTATRAPLPTPTSTPKPVPPMSTAEIVVPMLISPTDGDSVAGENFTDFEWQWDGVLQGGWGFEVLIWQIEEDQHYGAYDARELTEKLLKHHPDGSYTASFKVEAAQSVTQHGAGDYYWSVVVVRLDPKYERIGPEAPPHKLHISIGGGGDEGPGSKPPPPPP